MRCFILVVKLTLKVDILSGRQIDCIGNNILLLLLSLEQFCIDLFDSCCFLSGGFFMVTVWS